MRKRPLTANRAVCIWLAKGLDSLQGWSWGGGGGGNTYIYIYMYVYIYTEIDPLW